MAAGGSCQCRAVPWSVNDRNFWLPQGLNVVRIRRTYGTADPARFAGAGNRGLSRTTLSHDPLDQNHCFGTAGHGGRSDVGQRESPKEP